MSTYLRMGESPGGLDNTLLFGGMYGKELNFSPKGDYGASDEEFHGQKGSLYIPGAEFIPKRSGNFTPDWDPSLSTDSLPSEYSSGDSSASNLPGHWHWKKTVAIVLFLFAVITILSDKKFGLGSALMTNFPLQVMAVILGIALYVF